MHVQIVAVVPRYVMVNHLSQALQVCQASAVIATSTTDTTSVASSSSTSVIIPSKGQTAFHWSQPIRKKKSKQVCMPRYTCE
jgi:SHR-binding domain of vacuolar-sorting associated protein 13